MVEFLTKAFRFLIDALTYIINLRIVDIPLTIFYVAVIALIGYCTSMLLIGFPCSIWEAITKKKVKPEKQDKVIRIVAICLFVIFLLRFLYEQVS